MIDNVRNAGTAEPTQVTVVMLYSPDGLMTESFTLPAQQAQYDARIAEGWAKEQVAVTTETSVSVNDEDPNDYGNDTGEDGKKFSEMSPEELQKAYDSNKKAKSIMSGMALAFPGLGLLGTGATKHAENQIKKAMEALNYTPVDGKDGEGLLSGIKDSITNIFGGGKGPVVTPTSTVSTSTETAPAISLRPKPRPPVNNGSDDDPFKDIEAQVAATKDRGEKLKTTNAAVASASAEYESNRAAEAEMAEAAEAGGATKGGPGGTYGMNKGGLMQKKKK
jgi:hypothetical protein